MKNCLGYFTKHLTSGCVTSYLLCLAVFDIAYVMKKFWDFTKNCLGYDVRLCDMQITSYLLCLAVFAWMKKFWDFTKNLILKMTSGCLAVFAWMKTYLGFYQKSHLCRVGKIR